MGYFHNGVKLEGVCTKPNSSTNISLLTNTGNYDGAVQCYRGKGKIHAVRMYDRQLTEEEVMQNYQTDLNIYGV